MPSLSAACSPGTATAFNPQSRLPYLATYLGHKDVNSALVYLTVTQNLLQQASERLIGDRTRPHADLVVSVARHRPAFTAIALQDARHGPIFSVL